MTTTLIETPRLRMRKFTLADAAAVLEFSSNPEVTRYTGDGGRVKCLADAERVIRNVWLSEYERYGYARYALIHKADDKIIGFCGLKYEEELGGPDLGYRMLPDYWGQGLGSEAALATMEYAKGTLGMKRVQAMALPENIASNRVLKKIGFEFTRTMTAHGHLVNHYDYLVAE